MMYLSLFRRSVVQAQPDLLVGAESRVDSNGARNSPRLVSAENIACYCQVLYVWKYVKGTVRRSS